MNTHTFLAIATSAALAFALAALYHALHIRDKLRQEIERLRHDAASTISESRVEILREICHALLEAEAQVQVGPAQALAFLLRCKLQREAGEPIEDFKPLKMSSKPGGRSSRS